jgi:hypothetical protein
MQNHEARRIMLFQTIGYPVKWISDLYRSFADAKGTDCAAITPHSSDSRYRLALWPHLGTTGTEQRYN